MEEDRYTRITLRLPRDLHGVLDQAADATSKSLNAEIVGRLEASTALAGQTDQLRTRVSELEKELALQRLETFKERSKSGTYVFALMGIAKSIPPGVFAKAPHIEDVLNKVREDEHQISVDILERMLADTKTALSDLDTAVKSGRIQVVSEKGVEVKRRGELTREEPAAADSGSSSRPIRRRLVGNLGSGTESAYEKVIARATPPKVTTDEPAKRPAPIRRRKLNP